MKNQTCIALLILGLAAAGCGKKDEVVIDTPDGKVKVNTDNGGSTTIEGKDGKLSMSTDKQGNTTMTTTDDKGNTSTMSASKDVDMSELGVKLYPGAKAKEGQSGSAKIDTPEGTQYTVAVVTSDAPGKVIDFYKGELKIESSTNGPGGGMAMGKNAAGDTVMIITAQDVGTKETTITIQVVKKKK